MDALFGAGDLTGASCKGALLGSIGIIIGY